MKTFKSFNIGQYNTNTVYCSLVYSSDYRRVTFMWSHCEVMVTDSVADSVPHVKASSQQWGIIPMHDILVTLMWSGASKGFFIDDLQKFHVWLAYLIL